MQCTKEDQLFDFSCSRCSVVQTSTGHLNLHTGQKLLALSLTISNVFGLLSVDKIHSTFNKRLKCYFQSSAMLFVLFC